MDKNRFSRQLIVLRPVIGGYTGHARLVHSADGAEVEMRIQAPTGAGALYAVLVERTDSAYRSHLLGMLDSDERGQAAGRFPAENLPVAPDILAVVSRDTDCRLAMSGFPDGPRSVNWSDVRASACEAVAEAASAAQTLPPREDSSAPPTSAEDDPPHSPDGKTAAETAGISPDAVWPEEIAALQPEFETRPAVPAWPGSRYTFVRIEADNDHPEYLAGILCVHGLPEKAAYAVPAADRSLCPPGLEDFLWRSAADDGRGYWVAFVNACTGERIDGEP